MDFDQFLLIFVNFGQFLLIFVNFGWFLPIFVNFGWFLPIFQQTQCWIHKNFLSWIFADWLIFLLSNPCIDYKLIKKCVNHEILIVSWNICENCDEKIDQNRQKSIFDNFGWFWSSQNWQKLTLVDFQLIFVNFCRFWSILVWFLSILTDFGRFYNRHNRLQKSVL